MRCYPIARPTLGRVTGRPAATTSTDDEITTARDRAEHGDEGGRPTAASTTPRREPRTSLGRSGRAEAETANGRHSGRQRRMTAADPAGGPGRAEEPLGEPLAPVVSLTEALRGPPGEEIRAREIERLASGNGRVDHL